MDFVKELRNNKFKVALVLFFVSHRSRDEFAPFLKHKTLYVNFIECHKFFVGNEGNVENVEAPQFSCPSHEEADTKIIYQVCQVSEDRNIIIKCSDTDIFVILLSNMHHLKKVKVKFRSKLELQGKSITLTYVKCMRILEIQCAKYKPVFTRLPVAILIQAFIEEQKRGPLT